MDARTRRTPSPRARTHASFRWLLAGLAALALASALGCEGTELPPEVAAVSNREAGPPNPLLTPLLTLGGPQLVGDLPAGSDYHEAEIRKFVEIEALNQFSILATVFDAIRQTHHEKNIGDGWYKNLVAFREANEGEGRQTILQEWYVRSDWVPVGDDAVDRLSAKILEPDPEEGGVELIRAMIDIYAPPTKAADGTLLDLGVWELRAAFEEEGDVFQATATVLPDGRSLLTMQDQWVEMGEGGQEIQTGSRAVVVRSPGEGFGLIEFPNWDACFGEGQEWLCQGPPPLETVRFSYNDRYLSIQREGRPVVSFDRYDAHEVVHRYQVFSAEDGSRVERSRNMGFPVRTADGRHGWYGVWQDRHQLWLDGESAEDGQAVVRDDRRGDEGPAPGYTAVAFPGSLTRVTLTQGSLAQLRGVVAEVHVDRGFDLRWNAELSRWEECTLFDEELFEGQGGCAEWADFTASLPTLEREGPEDRRWIHVSGCLDEGLESWVCHEYVYRSGAPGPGFVEAEPDPQTGELVPSGPVLDTASLPGDFRLWVDVGGPVWAEYTGEFEGPTTTTGWVRKQMVGFDEETHTPSFAEEGDEELAFALDRDYFVNKRDVSLRVRRSGSEGAPSDYEVLMEVHRVAKPDGELGNVLAEGTRLVDGWDPEGSSAYVLDTDPESPSYLMLEYAEVGARDADAGAQVGDVVRDDLWGLRVEGDDAPFDEAVLFHWEYQSENEDWGGVTYLEDGGGQLVLLDEPLRFAPIALPTTDDLVQGRGEEEWMSCRSATTAGSRACPTLASSCAARRTSRTPLPSAPCWRTTSASRTAFSSPTRPTAPGTT
jgi:hypothetical protein